MELKSESTEIYTIFWRSSNRTFMELKSTSTKSSNQMHLSSNRTFMELKLTTYRRDKQGNIVLIAPLWNWNDLKFYSENDCSEF